MSVANQLTMNRSNKEDTIINSMGVEGATYLTDTVPDCIEEMAKKSNGQINIVAEKENIKKMLNEDNFFVNTSQQFVRALINKLVIVDNDELSRKGSTNYGMIMYIYLAIQRLYFGSVTSSESFSEKLLGQGDLFAERLAIIRILWDIYAKWCIKTNPGRFEKMLSDIDSVLAKDKLSTDDWEKFRMIFRPGFMLGFVIWLKYYYVPIIKIDVEVIRRTMCILDDKDKSDSYGFISDQNSEDPTIAEYYKIIQDSLDNIDKKQGTTSDCSEYEKQQNAKKKKNNKNNTSQSGGDTGSGSATGAATGSTTGSTTGSGSNTPKKNDGNKALIYDMTDAMVAIYYMGIILYYLKTTNEKIFNQLTADVKESYNIADKFAVTDIDRVNSIFQFILKDSKNPINFGKEDIEIMDRLLMEDTDLAGDANVSPFFSILSTYIRIKTFMGNLVESEKESAQKKMNKSHPLHLIQNLGSGSQAFTLSGKVSEGQKGGVSSASPESITQSIQMVSVGAGSSTALLKKRINRLNMMQITRAILNKMYGGLINNSIKPKWFVMFDVSSFPQFYSGSVGQKVIGRGIKNYIICAVTAGTEYSVAGDVIPMFWIQSSGKASQAQISLITKSISTPKVYDSSFDPKGRSIVVARISFDQNNDMVIKFDNNILGSTKATAVPPSDVSGLAAEYNKADDDTSGGVRLVDTNISSLINELSIVVRKTDKDFFAGDVVIKSNSGDGQVFHCVNMELTTDDLMSPLLEKKKGNSNDNNNNDNADGLNKSDRSEIFEGVQDQKNGAYLRHCNIKQGTFKEMNKVKIAKEFVTDGSYKTGPQQNRVDLLSFSGNFINRNDELNYNLAIYPLMLYAYRMSINLNSPFTNISKGIKSSLQAENLKIWKNETSKIVDVGKEGSIKDLFFSQGCSTNDLNSAIASVDKHFGSFASSASGSTLADQDSYTGRVQSVAQHLAATGKASTSTAGNDDLNETPTPTIASGGAKKVKKIAKKVAKRGKKVTRKSKTVGKKKRTVGKKRSSGKK